MITHRTGDILKDPAEAIVNPVNCVGVMGKGLALQFKKAYPAYYRHYAALCRVKAIQPGVTNTWENSDSPTGHRYIISFPTKTHWRNPSTLNHIHQGLHSLVNDVKDHNISSMAVPALGAGLGGLRWTDVLQLIELHMDHFPSLSLTIYHPLGTVMPRAETAEQEQHR